MHIDPLEKKWAIITGIMMGGIVVVLGGYAVAGNIHPPSHVETIDSVKLHLSEEFSEDNIGVKQNDDGSYTVTMVAARYGFYPPKIELPVNTPVKFRWASADVLHGVHVPFSNMSTMLVPGYVSEVNTEFRKVGEFPFLCNEYCGLGHDHMWARLTVTDQ